MSLPEQPPSTTSEIRRHQRKQAEEAADALETALRLARLPVPQGLSASYGAVDQGYGPRVYLGTVSLLEMQQMIKALHQYARLQGYLVDGEAVGLAAQVFRDFRIPVISGDGVTYVRRELD